ncbi:hypothetical protein TSOC_008678 [Tetrabaena socialis]|uniref:Uncharacterized protein n=1 Tax=Tetrabaena socialis TaxID=47790 RepID=A0A2J7ZXV3_9CHLO|nr:hypothetical protein TSOC_008678 [Tetrabaena socialis]|eukprot:PNH05097.1 hypothetical protein TSOC_008678 [Tetrabaena socialis]
MLVTRTSPLVLLLLLLLAVGVVVLVAVLGLRVGLEGPADGRQQHVPNNRETLRWSRMADTPLLSASVSCLAL